MVPLLTLALLAAASEHSLHEVATFAMGGLAEVIEFDEALEINDVEAISKITTEDFQIEPFLGRLLDENKALGITDLLEFRSRCTQEGRISSNHVAITVHYSCPNNMQGRMVFNFEDGRISRVSIGEIPIADVVAVFPADKKK